MGLDASAPNGRCRLYAGRNRMPTESFFDWRSATWNPPAPRLPLPAPDAPGTVYLLVMPEALDDGQLAFTLEVQAAQFRLTGIGVASAGNLGAVTIPLAGDGFADSMRVSLRPASGSDVAAQAVSVGSSVAAEARFDLAGVAPGRYTVVAALGNREAVLPDALTVSGSGLGGRFWARLTVPAAGRLGRAFTIYLEYGNAGDTDIAAPLVRVTAKSAPLRLWPPDQPLAAGTVVTLLAHAQDGAQPGVLRPGCSYRIPLRAQADSVGRADFGMAVFDGGAAAMDYETVRRKVLTIQPDTLWTNTWQSFVSQTGPTQGDYLAVLGAAASRARAFGLNLATETDLLEYLFDETASALRQAPVWGTLYLADTNHPLARQTVVLTPRSSQPGATNSPLTALSWYDGTFAVGGVPAGTYDVSVAGHLPETLGEVTLLDPLQQPLANLMLIVTAPAGALTGEVRAGFDASPITGALLMARHQMSGRVYSIQTALDGTYELEGLPPGDYKLELKAEGYLPQPARYFRIEPGQRLAQSYALPAGGGRIIGRVLRPDGGAVPGAPVAARIAGAMEARGSSSGTDTIADDAGAFVLAGLPPGTYRVSSHLDGIGACSVSDVAITDYSATVSLDLVLETGAPLTGTVLDAVTGAPVADACVWVRAAPDVAADATTDSAGRFTLTGLGAGRHPVLASANGYITTRVDADTGISATAPITILLGKLGSVEGHVRTQDGPLARVPIMVEWAGAVQTETQTDNQGHYGFLSLPPGDYRIGVGPQLGPVLWGADFTVSPTNASAVVRDFDLGAFSILAGRTRASDGTTPLPGTTVLLLAQGEVVAQVPTDAQGRYEFHVVQPGDFDLYAVGQNGWLTPLEAVAVGANQRLDGLDLLAPTSQLDVAVAALATGQPLGQAQVTVTPVGAPDGMLSRSASTGDDGKLSFSQMPAGDYRVAASAEGYAHTEHTVTIATGVASATLDLPAGRIIQGTVEARGVGMPDVPVFAARTGGPILFSTRTDAQGCYQFTSLPAELIDVLVAPERDRAAVIRERMRMDWLPTLKLDFDLVADGATVTGHVADANGRRPLPQTATLLHSSGLAVSARLTGRVDGAYALPRCPAGAYTLQVRGQGYLPVRQTLIVADTGGSLTNDTLVLGGPVAWAAPALTPNRPAVELAGYTTWMGGILTGTSPPEVTAAGALGDLGAFIEYWKKYRPEPCEMIIIPKGLPFAVRAMALFDVWKSDYEAMCGVINNDWIVLDAAAGAVTADTYLVEVAIATIGSGGTLAGVALWAEAAGAIGGAATSCLNALLTIGNSEASGADKAFAANNVVGAFMDVAKNLNSALPSWVPIGSVVAGLTGLVGDLINLWNVEDQLHEDLAEWLARCGEDESRFYTAYQDYLRHKHEYDYAKPDCGDGGATTNSTDITASRDPNGKITTGFGPAGWVRSGAVIAYTIEFENVRTAGAPAQQVVVTDRLAPELDWSTFELQQVAFNQVVIDVPPGLQYYRAEAFVASDPNPVRIEASLNPITGVATWRLSSVDPATDSLTEDPLAGFLPPNDAAHRGEGFVTFAVRPRPDLPSGAAVQNQARIVFDANAPIVTPAVTNTIAALDPTSAVHPLPTLSAPDFEVAWSGADPGGPGIVSYDIYVSVDDAPYAPWLAGVTAGSAVYHGQPGSSYAFRSIATDAIGNRQPPRTGPDATTEVPTEIVVLTAMPLEIRWRSVPGKQYFIETATDLGSDSQWETHAGPILARETVTNFIETPDTLQRFYRVRKAD